MDMNWMNDVKKTAVKLVFEAGKEWTEADLKVSDVVVGGKVEIIAEDGSLSPAADGQYLYSGKTLNVKDGQVESIEGEEAPAPVEEEIKAAEQDVPTDAPAEEAPPSDVEARLASLEEVVAAMGTALEELKTKGESLASKEDVDKFSTQVTDLNETFKVLAKIPAEFSKTNKSNLVKDDKLSKESAMLGIYAKLAKQ